MMRHKFRLGIRRDTQGIHIFIIAIIVIALIVVVAVVAVAWTKRDITDGGVSPEDAIAEIVIRCDIGDIDNQPGQVEVRDVDLKIDVDEVDYESSWPALDLNPFNWYYAGGEFEVTLKLQIKGPDGFLEDDLQDVQKIQLDEWTPLSKNTLDFKTMRCRVPQNGDYWVYAEIIVDSDSEGVEHEVCWSKNKLVSVEGF